MLIEEQIKIKASKETIFKIYEDVSNWSKWDPDVKKSSINGIFETGVSGKLKPTNGPEAKIKIIKVVPKELFTVESNLPLCIMTFEHELLNDNSETKVTHRVTFSGFLSPIFSRLIGNSIKKGLPATLKGLKHEAENRNSQ